MAWHGIQGHDRVVDDFRRCLVRGRLASSFLFVGPEGIGKRAFAVKLAAALLCTARPDREMDPCEACPACMQVAAGTHPDLEIIAKPEDKNVLLVEQFIGTRENRGKEGLCYNLARKPLLGTRKVAIVDDADLLEAESANCLLKTLEEPPPRTVLILIGTSAQRQLPTIRSRCQTIAFSPLPADVLADLILAGGMAEDPDEARRLATYSGGSLTGAAEFADPALWQFRSRLVSELARPDFDVPRLASEVNTFISEAGKESPPRRARARQVIRFAAEFYGQVVRAASGGNLTEDDELRTAALHAVNHGAVSPGAVNHGAASHGARDAESAAASVERCLEAIDHVDRYAYLPTLVDCWIDEIARTTVRPSLLTT